MNNVTPTAKKSKLVIPGTEDVADIAYEYSMYDSPYEVAGFTVDRTYLEVSSKFGLPVVAFDEVEQAFLPQEHELFSAIVYSNLNRTQRDVCNRAKAKGYKLASYISSHACIWHNVKLGEHRFIFEDNTVLLHRIPFSMQ